MADSADDEDTVATKFDTILTGIDGTSMASATIPEWHAESPQAGFIIDRRILLNQDALIPPDSSDDVTQTHGWLTRPAPTACLLPITGLWIVGLDWLLFSSNAVSLGLATPISVGLGLLLGCTGTLLLQRGVARDPWWKAALKAVVAGVLVGVPWPIGGTIAGGWILVASGLNQIRRR